MSLNIYIPRMLGTVTKKTIQDSFNALGIGRVDEIDMVYKVNENHNAYYFAFIKISPYNTPQSAALQTNLNKNKYIRFTYDEEAGQYWEIKKYIPRDQRGLHSDASSNTNRVRSDSPRSITSFDAVNGTENKPVNPSNVWKKTMQERGPRETNTHRNILYLVDVRNVPDFTNCIVVFFISNNLYLYFINVKRLYISKRKTKK